jgi:hypothetical protein
MSTLTHASKTYSQRVVEHERAGHRGLRVYILDTQFLVHPDEMRLIRKASKLSNVVYHGEGA